MNPKAIDHKLESEVLVIGSGLAGSLAAIKCHQLGAKVVIVTKGRLCGGGATILCAGFPMTICFPTDDRDLWMKEFVEWGEYIIDQERAKIHLDESYGYAMELDQLGKQYHEDIFPRDPRDKKDELWRVPAYPEQKIPMSVLFNGFAAEAAFRKKILADRIDFLERVEMTNLLTDGQRIVGAVGFNYRNGETYLFKAKAAILASGGTRFGVSEADNGGEGVAMAYEAGARISSLDKGGAIFRPKNTAHAGALGDTVGMGINYHLGAKLVNRLGEAFLEKASPELKAAGRQGIQAAIRKEVAEGRGPVFEDYTQIPLEAQEMLKTLKKFGWKLTKAERGVDIFKSRVPLPENLEQVAIPAGQARSGGGVEVDYQCASNIPGLYVVGDTAANNINLQHPFRGLALGGALLSGSRVAKFAVEYATSTPSAVTKGKESLSQAKEHFASLALPLMRTTGVSPEEIYSRLLLCLIPYGEVHAHKDNLERALSEITRLQREDLPRIKAKDYHELKKVIEVQAMVLIAEMILRSELFREESRVGVRRKDFPVTDNINWLKWIIVEKRDGKMDVYARDVPTPYIKVPRTSYHPRLLRV